MHTCKDGKAMKKRFLAITFILTLILTLFSAVSVFAGEEDDHGADSHSGSMSVYESEDDYEEELSFKDMLINTVKDKIKYVIAAVGGLVLLIVLIKVIAEANSRREPKYKGRH